MNLGNNHRYFLLSGYLSNAIHQSPTPVLSHWRYERAEEMIGGTILFLPRFCSKTRAEVPFAYIFSCSISKTTYT